MATDAADTTATQESIVEPIEDEDAASEVEERPEYPVSLDNVFEILKNQRRRHVLEYLNAEGGQVSLRSLSEYVAAEENNKAVEQLSSQERKRVYVGLYQCHLPKMDDMGFIEFDKNRGTIELGPVAHYADKYLHSGGGQQRRWPRYYLSLVGVGWLLLFASLASSVLSAGLAAGVFLVLLTSCALFHAYTARDDSSGLSFASGA